MDDPLITSARRRPRDTLAARAKENSPLLAAAGTVVAAMLFALAGYVQSCAAQQQAAAATVQATATQVQTTTTQVQQDKAGVEVDAAYKAVADRTAGLAVAVEELTRAATEQAARLERIEAAMGRRVKPSDEPVAPDVPVEALTEPLPASPAAAAANRRKP